ncbi:hypothetical protein [Algimonas ampicilliniresistens]|uniref:hypothetical protein n=1 Tax=Algimonas ampicilliniresistens TaxID=1298735 RepID=UPI0024E0CCBC|nr:hypothetical protein [Algimonas ampicilliniresistens]
MKFSLSLLGALLAPLCVYSTACSQKQSLKIEHDIVVSEQDVTFIIKNPSTEKFCLGQNARTYFYIYQTGSTESTSFGDWDTDYTEVSSRSEVKFVYRLRSNITLGDDPKYKFDIDVYDCKVRELSQMTFENMEQSHPHYYFLGNFAGSGKLR